MRKIARIPALLAVLAIVGYQKTVGRLVGQRCRFHPSCSEYALISIRENGIVRGGVAAAWRLLRCGPWAAGGVDHPRIRRVEGDLASG